MKNLFTCLVCGLLLVASWSQTGWAAEKLSQQEIREILNAINNSTNWGVHKYDGKVEKVTRLLEAVAESSPEKFVALEPDLAPLAELMAEKHSEMLIETSAWPGPQGITVSTEVMAIDSLGDDEIRFRSVTAVIKIEAEIDADPDAKLDEYEITDQYGFNAYREILRTAAQHSAVFFKMIQDGEQPYVLTETSCAVMAQGYCYRNDFEKGAEIIKRAADLFGNRNGAATPWEVERLSDYLPLVAEIGAGRPTPLFFVKDKINLKKAKAAFQELINIPTISDSIIYD